MILLQNQGHAGSTQRRRVREPKLLHSVGRNHSDPHVGNVFRPLDFVGYSRKTAAGSRIGHARVAAMLRGRYARLREQITLEKYALDIGTRKER